MKGIVSAMAELMVAEGPVCMQMAPAVRRNRVMIHNIARDMGLQSVSNGEGEDRYVVVSK
jgi:predicted RNA-binding protein Jag